MNEVYTTVKAIFTSYLYNREYKHIISLCDEVIKRVQRIKCVNWSDDGDIIYGILVIMFGDYGTSQRSGWIEEHIEDITECLNDLIEVYKRLEEEENEEN